MSDNGHLTIEVKTAGDGTAMATINGKVYRLLAGYKFRTTDEWFLLAVAGRTPLKADDLAEHWQVVRSGPVTLAFAQRPFSYHLLQGEDSEPPTGCDWPPFKRPPYWYAFVGPTPEAVEAQVRLALEQYRPDLAADAVLRSAVHAPDQAGLGPDALLVRV